MRLMTTDITISWILLEDHAISLHLAAINMQIQVSMIKHKEDTFKYHKRMML